MKTSNVILALRGRRRRRQRAATGWADARTRRQRHGSGRAAHGAGAAAAPGQDAQAPLLPQSDGPGGHLARRRRRTRWAWTTSRSTRARTKDADKPAGANQIRISTEKIQKLGVRTEAAAMRALGKTVRAAGRVEPDERRVVRHLAQVRGLRRTPARQRHRPAGRPRASRCSRSTAPSWCRPSASTPSRRKACRPWARPAVKRRPA